MFILFIIIGGLIGLFTGGAMGMLVGIFLSIAIPFLLMTVGMIILAWFDRNSGR